MTGGNGQRGAVAAGHRVTAEAAAEILADGGNAFDAAIAGLWAACVCEPVLASPGGGGFMMAHHEGETRLVDFFVDTPRAKRPAANIDFREILADFGTATQAFHIGAGATATPGFVPGLFAIHEMLGSLPMTRLVEPAIRAATGGVVMTPFQAYLFGVVSPILTATPAAAELFAEGGATLPVDHLFRNPALADALDALSREGPRLEREGEIGRAILEAQREAGQLTAADLAAYRVEIRKPLDLALGKARVFLNPPPALGGGLIAAMLAELGEGATAAGAADRALAIAGAVDRIDRLWRTDPEGLSRRIAAALEADRPRATRGTTHISVVDRNGNAAAVTVTNGEGNGALVPGAGYMLNNMLGEEDLNPKGFHRWVSGIRLASMMAPTVVVGRDGGLLALGSGGSNRIRTAVLQAIVARLKRGLGLHDAVEAPRLHVERGRLDFEDLAGEEVADALRGAFPDHCAWPEHNMFYGGVHAVELLAGGGIEAAGDPRRAGVGIVV